MFLAERVISNVIYIFFETLVGFSSWMMSTEQLTHIFLVSHECIKNRQGNLYPVFPKPWKKIHQNVLIIVDGVYNDVAN